MTATLRGLGYNQWGSLTNIGDWLQRLGSGPVTAKMAEYVSYGVFWYFGPISPSATSVFGIKNLQPFGPENFYRDQLQRNVVNCTLHPLHFNLHLCEVLLGMANLSDPLRCYVNLQKVGYTAEIAKLTTSGGRVTATLRKVMSYGDIIDDLLLVEYDEFIRKDPLASGFRNLLGVSWDGNLNNSSRKFIFNLTASSAGTRELQFHSLIQQTPTVKLPRAVTPEHESEREIEAPMETPSLKR